MKKCNGFYGCSLCVVRGKRKFGAHCYPHTDSIEMRDPRQHQRMADLAESGIVEKNPTENNDTEIQTKGVLGASKLFEIIENLPLSSPVDTMHQSLKGVAKDMLEFICSVVGDTTFIDISTSRLRLPGVFKRSVWSLRLLHLFKANELKFFLLYLSPIVFSSRLLEDSNGAFILRNLQYLVFSLRCLYDSSRYSEIWGLLLEAFCLNMSKNTLWENLIQ